MRSASSETPGNALKMASPSAAWRRTTPNSRSVRGPGLLRMCSGTLVFPNVVQQGGGGQVFGGALVDAVDVGNAEGEGADV